MYYNTIKNRPQYCERFSLEGLCQAFINSDKQYHPKAKGGERGGTINPRKRKVSEAEVRAVVSGLTFNNKGIANIGNANNTLFSKWN